MKRKKSAPSEPQRAPIGLQFRIRFNNAGKPLKPGPLNLAPVTVHTVGPKCKSNLGRWVCATHETSFANNLEKDLHIGAIRERRNHAGVCLLAWLCFDHGAEVP